MSRSAATPRNAGTSSTVRFPGVSTSRSGVSAGWAAGGATPAAVSVVAA